MRTSFVISPGVRTAFGRALRAGIALVGLAGAAMAAADARTARAICAAHDLHVLTLIEDHGLSGSPDVAEIVLAMESLHEAREACRDGRLELALVLYERATLDPPLRPVAGHAWR